MRDHNGEALHVIRQDDGIVDYIEVIVRSKGGAQKA
jgi:hypothetical protein